MYRLFRNLLLIALAATATPAAADSGEAEKLFANSLQELRQNQMDDALTSINRLLERYPNFKLAQLVKGDLLLAHAQPLVTLGNARGANDQQSDLREEARVRIKAISNPVAQELIPEELSQLSDNIRHAIAVDAARSRLYVFENSPTGIRRVADFYVTIGKLGIGKNKEGDKRTPIGLYTIKPFKPDSELEELYGVGAYPLNYPNEWDTRHGRNGHGIWIHGVPRETYARPPKASDGCVVLSNQDMKTLGRFIKADQTPIIIAQKLTWSDPADPNPFKNEVMGALANWQNDWESLDTNRLLSHYSQKLKAGGKDYREFSQSKRRVNAAKTWVKINLSDLSIYRQPDSADTAIITFTQHYQSSNLNNQSRKRQYWQRENGRWRIIHETIL